MPFTAEMMEFLIGEWSFMKVLIFANKSLEYSFGNSASCLISPVSLSGSESSPARPSTHTRAITAATTQTVTIEMTLFPSIFFISNTPRQKFW